MAEKRKLPARERRESAAKRRASEAAPQTPSQPQSSSSRKKGPTPGVASTATSTPPSQPPEPVVSAPPLPTKIKEGEGLPTVPTPQKPTLLSDKEYQSIAESAVLLASLERSKRKWLSDGILIRYWTKPKKTKREQIEGKNPPKESMSKVGPCHIIVGPHFFDAMLYTVKDPNAPPPIQYTPPQRPMVHYGHPNNFQQYHPYPHPPPPPPQTPQAIPPQPQVQPIRQAPPPPPPQPGYQPRNQQTMRPPSHQGRGPNHASPNPPPPPPGPQQRPSPSQSAQPQPPKPSPDPVIQMLATRAASDPELKALMRVVASTEATQEQLRAFQAHIDELNAIIRAREQRQQQRQQAQQPVAPSSRSTGHPAAQMPLSPHNPPQQPSQQSPPQQPSQQSPPQQSPPQQQQQTPQAKPQTIQRVEVQVPPYSPAGNPPSQQITSQPQTPIPPNQGTTPQVKEEPEPGVATPTQPPASVPPSGPNTGIAPGPSPVTDTHPDAKPLSPAIRPMPQPSPQSAGPRPGPAYSQYQQQSYQQTPPIHSRPPQYGSPAQYYRPAPPPPPPRMNYKSVVFEFTSPLTPYGSSTSGHAGSGDRYLFPENTILEWLSGGTAVLASFLLVRKVDPSVPFPIETAMEVANSRVKGKSTSKSKKSGKKKKANDDNVEGSEKSNDKSNQPATPANSEQAATTLSDTKEPDRAPETSNEQSHKKGQQFAGTASMDTKPDESQKDDNPDLKEYYQPVTFHIQSPNPKVLEPLSRVVKPPDEVRRYMNEIMDRAERAPDGFLAMRLPREGVDQDHLQRENEDNKKGVAGTPMPGPGAGAGHRSRSSRGGKVALLEQDGAGVENTNTISEDAEEEEELKDFYGAPTGVGFW